MRKQSERYRQADLPERIKRGEELRLVGMGTYIIQPIYVDDLVQVMLECETCEQTYNRIFCIGGPDAVENRTYYEYIGKALGTAVKIREIPLEGYLEAHPEYSGHLCHRVYDLSGLKNAGVRLPSTKLEDGIQRTISEVMRE